MLIDWVTCGCSLLEFTGEELDRLNRSSKRIREFDPQTGEVAWEVSKWGSIRSDSHAVSWRVTPDALLLKGSPARCMGEGDAAFGSGASRALDLVGCVARMTAVACGEIGVTCPEVRRWKVTRTDTTQMLLLPSLADVRSALAVLRNCEGGRYRVSQQAGDTVYWSHKSRLRAGKAYAKGPHLRQAQQKKSYAGVEYSVEQLTAVDRCLRLELTHGSQFWRERAGAPWWDVTAEQLRQWHVEYFGRMLGLAEVTSMNVEARIMAAARTDGQGKAAVGCWALIQGYGWEYARARSSRSTWYRNLQVLRAAGLADADISAGNVVRLRRPLIQCAEVSSWGELLREVA